MEHLKKNQSLFLCFCGFLLKTWDSNKIWLQVNYKHLWMFMWTCHSWWHYDWVYLTWKRIKGSLMWTVLPIKMKTRYRHCSKNWTLMKCILNITTQGISSLVLGSTVWWWLGWDKLCCHWLDIVFKGHSGCWPWWVALLGSFCAEHFLILSAVLSSSGGISVPLLFKSDVTVEWMGEEWNMKPL